MSTRVIQEKDRDDYSPNDLVSVVHPSPWKNPFKTGRDGTREEILDQFESYFLNRVEEDPEFRAKTLELKGKVLVCDCDCDRDECHAMIVAEWVDSESAQEGPVVAPRVVQEGPMFCDDPPVQIHFKGPPKEEIEEEEDADSEAV